VKVAIVCDWLTTVGGAERVVKTVSEVYPKAPIFTSQYSEKEVDWFKDCDVRTGWLNIFPASLRKFLSPLRAIYFKHLNLKEYDVVISIVCGESKNIRTHKNQTHISYLQGPPTQYYWGMHDFYLKNPGFGKLNWLVRPFFKAFTGIMRKTDFSAAQRPDHLVTISTYCAEEIEKYYGRKAEIVHPPVNTEKFKLTKDKSDFFFTTSRQINWKRLDLAVKACIKTGDRFVLVGSGAEHEQLVKLAEGHDNIEFIPIVSDVDELVKTVSSAKGCLFPSLEPFGITPIESLSMGAPVIAFKAGGALDYIQDGKNGIFFEKQTVDSMASAIQKFNKTKFDAKTVSQSAKKFSVANFKKEFKKTIDQCIKK
jgi:glycosyltransferase involved in cell wall biosynthesis